jgi:hypothetical protein
MNPSDLRPRDLALLLLASGELLPRRRARDQQADLAGMSLRRRLLERVAALDPEGQELESCLTIDAAELETPSGPVLALARQFLEEWRMALASPTFVEHLLTEATQRSQEDAR